MYGEAKGAAIFQPAATGTAAVVTVLLVVHVPLAHCSPISEGSRSQSVVLRALDDHPADRRSMWCPSWDVLDRLGYIELNQ